MPNGKIIDVTPVNVGVRHACVSCNQAMRCKKNEVVVNVFYDNGQGKHIFDYACYADLWECPTCGREIITGFGRQAFWTCNEGGPVKIRDGGKDYKVISG